jgi:hypothetical protein
MPLVRSKDPYRRAIGIGRRSGRHLIGFDDLNVDSFRSTIRLIDTTTQAGGATQLSHRP